MQPFLVKLCLGLLFLSSSQFVFADSPDKTSGDTCIVQADFSIDTDSCKVYQFTDLSTATAPATIVGWDWDFGDGNSSTLQNPQHSYGSPGSHVVSLTVTAVMGTDTCYDTAYGVASDNCDSCAVRGVFLMTPRSQDSCTWVFVSNSTTWGFTQVIGISWDFGDGNTSNSAIPVHTYAAPGTYNICLTYTAVNGNDTCYHTLCDSIYVNCKACEVDADFTFTLENDSCEVAFQNASSGLYGTQILSYLWDFDDGTTSTATSPSHFFPYTGSYEVCLTVSGTNGGDTCEVTVCDTVTVACDTCAIDADFSYDAGDSCTVDFTDQSTLGSGTSAISWLWDFGNGMTSTQQNPSHTFAGTGTFIVTLTITGAAGTDTCQASFTDSLYLECDTSACELDADFGYYVDDTCRYFFTDLSSISPSGSITSWLWDFGDGTTSTLQNPTHIFPGQGSFLVCLTITGSDSLGPCPRDSFCVTIEETCHEGEGRWGKISSQPWSLAPNPVRHTMRVIGQETESAPHRLTVTDLYGRQLVKTEFSGNEVSLDVGRLAEGLYFLEVDGKLVGRFVKVE